MYLATPVNGRDEETLEQKRIAAHNRVKELKVELGKQHPDWNIVSAFDVCPAFGELDEAEAMGRCIALLMTCDGIVMDKFWRQSRGCRLEHGCALIYRKEIVEL